MFQPPPASGLPGPPPPPPPPVPIASTHPPFRTAGFHGYAVQFSPFLADRLAVASAAHFGIVGNGRLWVLRGAAPGTPAVPLRVEATFDTQDGLYDLAWSETHEHHVVTASGDGTIKLWDVSLPDPTPVQHWAAHAREVFGVAWRPCGDKRHFASVAWDGALRVWEPGRGEAVAHIQAAPAGVCVYAAAWHPVHAPLLATAAADGCARVWDLRAAANNGCLTDAELARRPPPQDPQAAACPPAGGVRLAHPGAAEVLSVDWNRYAEHVLFTGGVDRVLRVWDTRWPTQP
ncbi:WD40 repeat-like protein, partial [Caulochytrium protostelioides]